MTISSRICLHRYKQERVSKEPNKIQCKGDSLEMGTPAKAVQATNAGIRESTPQAQVDPSASQVRAVEVRDVGMRNGETYAAAYHPPLDLYDLALPAISSHPTRTCTRTSICQHPHPITPPPRSSRSRQNHPKEHQQAYETHHLATHIQQPVPHPHPLLLRALLSQCPGQRPLSKTRRRMNLVGRLSQERRQSNRRRRWCIAIVYISNPSSSHSYHPTHAWRREMVVIVVILLHEAVVVRVQPRARASLSD
jgi:hypothetical protein